jgi:hypothetical protein
VAVAPSAADLVVSGTLLADGPDATAAIGPTRSADERPIALRLHVPAAVRQTGHGPITLELEADGLRITHATLVWMVTTNKGWAHLRGLVGDGSGSSDRPFRADLYAASLLAGTEDDRVALRVYDVGADPDAAGPTHKLQGRLPRGSVRLGR